MVGASLRAEPHAGGHAASESHACCSARWPFRRKPGTGCAHSHNVGQVTRISGDTGPIQLCALLLASAAAACATPTDFSDATLLDKQDVYTKLAMQSDANCGYVHPFAEPIPPLTSAFGPRRHPILGGTRHHAGVDFGAAAGRIVRAAVDGVVTVARFKDNGYGNQVEVTGTRPDSSGDAFQAFGAHYSEILVKEGQKVRATDPVALVGSTGRSTGPHLHFEVKRAPNVATAGLNLINWIRSTVSRFRDISPEDPQIFFSATSKGIETCYEPERAEINWKFVRKSLRTPASKRAKVELAFTAPDTPGAINVHFWALKKQGDEKTRYTYLCQGTRKVGIRYYTCEVDLSEVMDPTRGTLRDEYAIPFASGSKYTAVRFLEIEAQAIDPRYEQAPPLVAYGVARIGFPTRSVTRGADYFPYTRTLAGKAHAFGFEGNDVAPTHHLSACAEIDNPDSDKPADKCHNLVGEDDTTYETHVTEGGDARGYPVSHARRHTRGLRRKEIDADIHSLGPRTLVWRTHTCKGGKATQCTVERHVRASFELR